MEVDLNTAALITSILVPCCALFNYAILRPLKMAIDDLRSMIADVRVRTDEDLRERHMIEVKLAKVEDAAKSAHHRIDTLEQRS